MGIFLPKIVNEVRGALVGIGESNVASEVDDKGLEVYAELEIIALQPQPDRIVETA